MTIQERMGQFLFIGLPGPSLDAEARELLTTVQPGGIIHFARNLESAPQVADLNARIRAALNIQPLVSIDQEGGVVDRLKAIGHPMPSVPSVRATEDASLMNRLGAHAAELLRILGFNMNFAPVLDLEVDPDADNALKNRYFGATTADVIRYAGAYVEGLQQGGVLACGKHFPGLGDSTIDSHKSLPTVERSGETLRRNDLLPYAELTTRLNARLETVMIAHACFPAFDSERVPASLSPNVTTTLLRDEMEFKGLAISDDMEMGAIAEMGDFGEACVRAIEAGNDQLLVCMTPARIIEAHEALVRAAEAGRISPARRKRGLDRIARVKSMLAVPMAFNDGTWMRAQEKLSVFTAQLAAASAHA